MLFPKVDEVNEVWRMVCEGVAANRLGIGAKVSISVQEDRDPMRLICVYTKNLRMLRMSRGCCLRWWRWGV
jgi:hypothetical protein